MLRSLSLLLVVIALGSGCRASQCAAVRALPGEADVLVVGDSILAWNNDRCLSAADQMALARGAPVRSEAISGTRMLSGENRIPDQVVDGDFRVYVIDGGANDLNSSCECGACDAVLDALVSEDGATGAMPQLVDSLGEGGARVLLLRYYETRDGAWYGFDRCHEVLARLGDRYERLAERRAHVTLVDARDVVDPSQPALYDFDNVHPSDEGAKKLGEALARALGAP